jgi:hypothetical protein
MYVPIGTTYGAIRKGLQVINAPVVDKQTTKASDMYVTTKVVLVAHGAFFGSVLWPLMAIKDVYQIEANIRGDTNETLNCEANLNLGDCYLLSYILSIIN